MEEKILDASSLSNWVEIDVSKFLSNIKEVRKKLKPNVKLMLILKANAYGHGAVELAKAAQAIGENCFGLARIEEAIELRNSGIKGFIHILSGCHVGVVKEIVSYNLIPSIADISFAKALNTEAKRQNKIILVHIKVDTGMNRYGIKASELEPFLILLKDFSNLKIEGVFSHLADSSNKDFTNNQIKIFENYDFKNLTRHLLSSDGLINFPDHQYEMVRVGRLLYEINPILEWKAKINLIKEVKIGESIGYGCTFKAKKDMKIANIMCGYADGYNRKLSNKGFVLIKGKKCKILGRISMDQMTVDVSNINEINLSDIATLIGKQDKNQITAEDLAKKIGTINYEIWTSIANRVRRIFISNNVYVRYCLPK